MSFNLQCNQVFQRLKTSWIESLSWFKPLFKFSTLAKLLDNNEHIDPWIFLEVYDTSWWWNRWWFKSLMGDNRIFESLMFVSQSLRKKNLYNAANRKKIEQANLHLSLGQALNILNTVDCLTQITFEVTLNHSQPVLLANTFNQINNYPFLLKANNFKALARIVSEELVRDALPALNNRNLLNEENFQWLTTSMQPSEFGYGLCYLYDHNALNQENIQFICRQPILSLVIVLLARNNLFNQDIGEILVEHPYLPDMIYPLGMLESAHLLNRENLETLLNPQHQILLVNGAMLELWARIPEGFLTQDLFNQLVLASEQPQRFYAIVNGIIFPGLVELHGRPRALNHLETTAVFNIDFNNDQSTHHVSVHRSVSESAICLHQLYGADLQLNITIKQIKQFIHGLSDTHINNAAKRCIERLTHRDYHFQDASGISTIQLLALAYVAIHDETRRFGTLEDAKLLFIQGLYECQRGYNLNQQNIDNMDRRDSSICLAGTFNKIMEKLGGGVHSEVCIYYITHEGATLKFPKFAQECASNYLKRLINRRNLEAYLKARSLLTALKDSETLVPIWELIQADVQAKLWDEFKVAYREGDLRFDDLLRNYIYAPIPKDLLAIEAELEAVALDLRPLIEAHGLWAKRHQSSDDQHQFDLRYGLTLKNTC